MVRNQIPRDAFGIGPADGLERRLPVEVGGEVPVGIPAQQALKHARDRPGCRQRRGDAAVEGAPFAHEHGDAQPVFRFAVALKDQLNARGAGAGQVGGVDHQVVAVRGVGLRRGEGAVRSADGFDRAVDAHIRAHRGF